ncbi:NADH-quinone oxidoreductase subunit J family protein [Pontibacter akesuensis]|uniref:NADH-quinone oxidoreductase subunit J n=1 Tax=Pontibacter akesuensis TaxID=388950 RepID=A0A1I7K8G4_9BACT|nr:NADH-quinone oxidoreductase subunit J [Pontibacter akesuensis]GHA74322.1 NADH dehydrogenase subunit J [Pontibacter akesuensis]SFU93701.1 NADH dehydrogenase subunit J [Pontibacter akesuensis]
MTESLFFFLASLTLLCALMVVISKNPVHSVLFLIITFFTISGHYILLNAQFLAAVNIIVYAGAIMVLFLFVIMFLNMSKDSEKSVKTSTLSKFAGTIAGGLLFVILIAALKDTSVMGYDAAVYDSQVGMVENLGFVLYTQYLLPFELASVLFLVAMVGAVMLGKKEKGEAHF